MTTDRPFLDLRLFRERNFALGIGIATVFGMLFVTPMVLMPAMMQQLRDVPELTVGMLIGMRGAGTATSQVLMILFAHRWNPRVLFLIGFATHSYAGLIMAHFDMNVSLTEILWTMAIQGFGVGCLWVPMTLVIFSNFDPRRSAEGSALFHFVRSIASSYFISASFVVVFRSQKVNYSDLIRWINPFNEGLSLQGITGIWSTESVTGLAGIAGEVTRQATTIGFLNAANLFLWTSLLVYPLIALVVWPPRGYRPRP